MKDKSLAVSKRDRQLLSILLAFVLLFLLYYFVAGPAFDRGNSNQIEREMAEADLQQMQMVIDQSEDMQAAVDAKRDELSKKYAIFLHDVNEAKLLHQLDALMASSGFQVAGYQQSESAVAKVLLPTSDHEPLSYPILDLAKKLNPALVDDTEQGNNISEDAVEGATPGEAVELPADAVEQRDLSLIFLNAEYGAMYRFLASLEALERTFIISELSIGKDGQSQALQGQIIIKSITLPKISNSEIDEFIFLPTVPKGRTSPF